MAVPHPGFADSLPMVEPLPKPRRVGLTEIRNPAYGLSRLTELTESLGHYIDTMKWTCATQRLVDRDLVKAMNTYLLDNQINVSSGGMLERVALNGQDAIDAYLKESAELSFTIIEVSTGLGIMPLESKTAIIKRVLDHGMDPKPEVAMSYGQGDDTTLANADFLLREIDACLAAGAKMIMVEEEGIFRYVDTYETDLVHKMVREVGLEYLMFEASDIKIVSWLFSNYGPDVNIFTGAEVLPYLVAHRTGIWGAATTWGRMAAYRD